MVVAFDAVGPSSSGASSLSSTTVSWTHTNGASGVALFAAIGVGISPDGGFSVTVALDPAGANTPFTSLGSIRHANDQTAGFLALFGLANVSSGAHTITATASGGTPASLEGGSLSYTGAGTTVETAFSAQQSAAGAGTSASVTFTGSTSGNMVAASCVNGANVASMTTGTSRWIVNASTSSAAGNQGGGDIAAGGSVTPTWSTSDDWWAAAAVEVLVASAVSPVPDLFVVRSNLQLR